MDKYIKQSIESRKNAIFSAYELDEKAKEKVDKLFGEIEKLGSECKEVNEFETKFATSPLNQKYLDLFTEVATGSAGKQAVKQTAKSMAGGIAEGMVRNAIGDVVPTRAAVHQKARDVASGVPILGDTIDVGQKASYAMHLGKLFGARKKKE